MLSKNDLGGGSTLGTSGGKSYISITSLSGGAVSDESGGGLGDRDANRSDGGHEIPLTWGRVSRY